MCCTTHEIAWIRLQFLSSHFEAHRIAITNGQGLANSYELLPPAPPSDRLKFLTFFYCIWDKNVCFCHSTKHSTIFRRKNPDNINFSFIVVSCKLGIWDTAMSYRHQPYYSIQWMWISYREYVNNVWCASKYLQEKCGEKEKHQPFSLPVDDPWRCCLFKSFRFLRLFTFAFPAFFPLANLMFIIELKKNGRREGTNENSS